MILLISGQLSHISLEVSKELSQHWKMTKKFNWLFNWLWLLKILPRNKLSWLVGRFVQIRRPAFFVKTLKRWFVSRYHLRLDEAEKPFTEYPSLGDLFIRKLKPGIRPLGEGLIDPCDASLEQYGRIDAGKLIQAKGIFYDLEKLVPSAEWATKFRGGYFVTYYDYVIVRPEKCI